MNDDLDIFKQRLRAAPLPEPSRAAKNLALAKADAVFAKNILPNAQGKGLIARLFYAAQAVSNFFNGRWIMKKAHLIGTVSAVALVLVMAGGTYSYLNFKAEKEEFEDYVTLQTRKMSSSQSLGDAVRYRHSTPAPSIGDWLQHESRNLAESTDKLLEAPPALPNAKQQKISASMTAAQPTQSSVGMGIVSAIPMDSQSNYYQDQGRDQFKEIKTNPLKLVKEEPVSTFSIDVDTSSYSFMRAALNSNVLPQKDAVRIEELVNYFPYNYTAPEDRSTPFKANLAVMPTPWNTATKLIHIGIKGYEIKQAERPRANLVFLIDTSGSMNAPNKLPLVQNALKMLLDTLQPEDHVAIVTYAGRAGTVLEPTAAKDKQKIASAIDNLGAGGSTAGAEGLRQAYNLAQQNLDKNAINRVLLATDGDFNVGITDPNELKSFIERQRATGIYLSVLGFGMGNYNDQLMQELAQNGNGNAAYIDSLNEARKALVQEAGSTLFPIAKDVKIQVEFNPATVAEYRLIGYETRLLNREDFNNDKVDAGEIGAGHTVTALYEITPVDSEAQLVDDLRYGEQPAANKTPQDKKAKDGDEYAFVKIRYKLPEEDTSKLITTPVDKKVEHTKWDEAPQEARFAATVAGFGQLIRGDAFIKQYSYDDVINAATAAKGEDVYGYRAEFINLVRAAKNAPALPLPVPADVDLQLPTPEQLR